MAKIYILRTNSFNTFGHYSYFRNSITIYSPLSGKGNRLQKMLPKTRFLSEILKITQIRFSCYFILSCLIT